jgi:predicted transcriptional regulator
MQNPEIYLSNKDNIFHQLRGHFLKINIERHGEKSTILEEKKIPVNSLQQMQMKILEGRMQKLKYEKLRKKGENEVEGAAGGTEEDVKTNLQKYGSSVGYYTIDNLLDRLKQNDVVPIEEEKKPLSWKDLSEDDQKLKMREFILQFRSGMEEDVWVEMSKDVFRNMKTIPITWHKKSQKILEIPNLVIHQSCFFWNFD